MRVAVAAVLLAASCTSGPAARNAPTSTAPSSPVTPNASPLAPVEAVAESLRAAAGTTLAACPCRFRVTVRDVEKQRQLELLGLYFPRTGTADLGNGSTGLRIVGGDTYYRGPESGGTWVRLDFRDVPANATTRGTEMALSVAFDPAHAFAMAAATYAPHLNSSGKGRRSYSVSFDPDVAAAAAGGAGPLLRRLLGTPSPYGQFLLRGPYLEELHYDVLAPGVTDRHVISVDFRVVKHRDTEFGPPAAPPGARTVVVK